MQRLKLIVFKKKKRGVQIKNSIHANLKGKKKIPKNKIRNKMKLFLKYIVIHNSCPNT